MIASGAFEETFLKSGEDDKHTFFETAFRKVGKHSLALLLIESFSSLCKFWDAIEVSPFRTSVPLRLVEILAESRELSNMMGLLLEVQVSCLFQSLAQWLRRNETFFFSSFSSFRLCSVAR